MRHLARVLGCALPLLALATGCDALIGLPDVPTADEGGAGADAGLDSGVDTGAPPAADGEAEAAPDAPAPACGQGLPTSAAFLQLVKSCALTVSCDPLYFGVTITDCITYDAPAAGNQLACLAAIDSCTDFYDCQHARLAGLPDCPNAGSSQTCSGQVATLCSGQGKGAVIDCAGLGGTCSTSSSDGTYPCIVVPSCSDTDGQAHCSNGDLYLCVDGQGFGQSCAQNLGATCATVGGVTSCYYGQTTCTKAGTYECAGTTLDYCSPSGQLLQSQCGATGSTCAVAGAQGYCVSAGCTTASASACKESCSADGKSIETCIAGAPYTIDCTTLGSFTACTQSTDTSTTPATVYTYCE